MSISLKTLQAMKQAQEKIACLTVYDASFAHLLEAAGVEVLLVGDSLGMVIQGQATTLPVTMQAMLYHTECVARAIKNALLVVDMPFMSYATLKQALRHAGQLMQAGAHMVKLEGGQNQAYIVQQLTAQGIPVCAHIGLQPQSVHKLGGYRVQGRAETAAQALLADAQALQVAGADLLIAECIPMHLAQELQAQLSIPVIGIGAGVACDGQILVLYDILGITPHKIPKFAHNFLQSAPGSIQGAVSAYVQAVKTRQFPDINHSFQ